MQVRSLNAKDGAGREYFFIIVIIISFLTNPDHSCLVLIESSGEAKLSMLVVPQTTCRQLQAAASSLKINHHKIYGPKVVNV